MENWRSEPEVLLAKACESVAEAVKAVEKEWMEGEKKWKEEKEKLVAEKKELEEKARKMEERLAELGAARAASESSEEERKGEAEKRYEEEMANVSPMTEVQWEKELEERKRCATILVIVGLDKRDDKEKAVRMMREEMGRGFKEEELCERRGRDSIRRWFYKCSSEAEKKSLLERSAEVKEEWKLKIGEEKTFRERKTKAILDMRAERERRKNKATKIRIEKEWICIDGNWEKWMEKEAKWMKEEDWEQVMKEKERKSLEERLSRVTAELAMTTGPARERNEEAGGGH